MLLRFALIGVLALATIPTAAAGYFCDDPCAGGGLIFDYDRLCVATDYSFIGNHHAMHCTKNPFCPAPPIPEYCWTGYSELGGGVQFDDITME